MPAHHKKASAAISRSRPQSALRYPLTDMLGAEANVRVLRELVRHGGEIATPSLILRTGLAQSSVREALVGLQSMQIVEALGSGRSQLFRLRSKHPLAPAVANLFDAEETRFEAVLASVRSAAAKSVIAAWLYGSVARGEDRPDSDLDVAVVADYGRLHSVEERMREALSSAGESLAFRSSVVVIDTRDVQRLTKERDPWWQTAIRDSIPIVGERPEMLATWLDRRTERVRRKAG